MLHFFHHLLIQLSMVFDFAFNIIKMHQYLSEYEKVHANICYILLKSLLFFKYEKGFILYKIVIYLFGVF